MYVQCLQIKPDVPLPLCVRHLLRYIVTLIGFQLQFIETNTEVKYVK